MLVNLHMWISRCFNLIFTAIKTKKEKMGVMPTARKRPQQSDRSAASGIFFSRLVEGRLLPRAVSRAFLGPLEVCATWRKIIGSKI